MVGAIVLVILVEMTLNLVKCEKETGLRKRRSWELFGYLLI